ncbi:MAG: hypothetical protein KJO85_00005, partial [Gammaproteobacteria bacterium]|nr:hypothetical protein [Gammaproteobacteria bacterium]
MINGTRLFAKFVLLAALFSISNGIVANPRGDEQAQDYAALVRLFNDWRAFESAPSREGVPDYTATTMASQLEGLKGFRQRLEAFNISDWPVAEQVDWHLLRAEMNGLEFNTRVLKSWQRDPAFYTSVWTAQSDTPAHEGPTHHALIELWTYDFPLSPAASTQLATELGGIAPLLQQARINLTGNARELWVGGITNIREQADALRELALRIPASDTVLHEAIDKALVATESFISWLVEQSPSKNGPSGVSKEHYTWHLRNVLLVPLSWDEERYL